MGENKPKVRVFSTPTCPYCVALKGYLKEHNIEFEDIDVSQDLVAQKEMIDRSGQYGVPVADINGEIIIGFNQERINQLLNIK
jgi:glutaredoxin-like YruB-family protein